VFDGSGSDPLIIRCSGDDIAIQDGPFHAPSVCLGGGTLATVTNTDKIFVLPRRPDGSADAADADVLQSSHS
jgi:hypothetical protein